MPQGTEGEFAPGSDNKVLRNKLGIKNVEEMDFVEYEALLTVQQKYYNIITPETQFTASLIKNMHRDFLGGIYEWAGKYRSVELEKAGFRWPPACLVPANMDTFERDILTKRTPCIPGDLDRICEDIAVMHAEFLFIHPFRDGNGRLARLIADLMTGQAGYPVLDLGFEHNLHARDEYIIAVQAGYTKDFLPLKQLIREAITRSLESLNG